MEQLTSIVNNLNNTYLMFFASGISVPIIVYLLSQTSMNGVFRIFSLANFGKIERFVIQLSLITLIIFLIIISFALENKDSTHEMTMNTGSAVSSTALDSSDATLQKMVASMPGMDGDRSKRYTVSFLHADDVQPNEDVQLTFKVTDASNGNEPALFKLVYGKPMHLVIVDSELKYFTHIHPEQKENEFVITTQFPKTGIYRLYIDFQPWGAIEQQFAYTLHVGNVEKPVFSTLKPDNEKIKTFKEYNVKISTPILDSKAMSLGQQQITFHLTDAKTGKPLTNLKPYLQAFGHMVMINEETFDYLHVHPYPFVVAQPNQTSGPDVRFLPMAVYGPIKPGIYRVFAQFNPDDKLFTSDFTVMVK